MKKNPRGRPPLARGERTESISVKLPASDYRRTADRSRRERVSMPAVVREALRRHLDDEDDDSE